MTGVAGRGTVLTEDAELLFGVTAGEAGGIAAAFTLLLAPLAPLAAPAESHTVILNSMLQSRHFIHLVLPEILTFLGFHVFTITVGEVILYSAFLHSLSIIVVVIVIEPQLLVLIQ